MFSKVTKFLVAIILVVVVVYACVVGLYRTGKANPNENYLAQINESIVDAPGDQKAWLVYRPAWISVGALQGGYGPFNLLFRQDEENNQVVAAPGDDEWEVCKERLVDLKTFLEATREGSKLPILGLELKTDINDYSDLDRAALFPNSPRPVRPRIDAGPMDGMLFGILLPHTHVFKLAAHALHADTRFALEENDPQRAVDNICAIFGLSKHASDPKFLVSTLIAVSVQCIGIEVVDEVLSESADQFSVEQLEQIRTALRESEGAVVCELEMTRVALLDVVQHAYTNSGNGHGWLTQNGKEVLAAATGGNQIVQPAANSVVDSILGPLTAARMPGRKQTTDAIEELTDLAKLDLSIPYFKNSQSQVELFLQKNGQETKYLMASMLFPKTNSVRIRSQSMIMLRESTDAAIAAHLFRKTEERWPKDWDDLIAEGFVAAAPTDMFTGNPLFLSLGEKGVKIYSTGPNQSDDGGAPLTTDFGKPKNATQLSIENSESQTSDWILWPIHDAEVVESNNATKASK